MMSWNQMMKALRQGPHEHLPWKKKKKEEEGVPVT